MMTGTVGARLTDVAVPGAAGWRVPTSAVQDRQSALGKQPEQAKDPGYQRSIPTKTAY